MTVYGFDDYDQHGSLKVSGWMWFWLFYSLRHAIMWLGLSISHTPDMIYDLTNETHWIYILCGIPVAMVLVDTGFRTPDVGEFARGIWKHGRWLMAASILLHVAITIGLGVMKPEWTVSAGQMMIYALDALGLHYILKSQRVKDVFADFPAKIEKDKKGADAKPEQASQVEKNPAPETALPEKPVTAPPAPPAVPPAPPEPIIVHVSEAVQIGINHQQAGQLVRAEEVFTQILDNFPEHADALHLLGLVNHQRGMNQKAEQFILRAIAAQPGVAIFHGNLGIIYQAQRKMPEAIAQYETALRIHPDLPGVNAAMESLKGHFWLQAKT